MYLRHTQVRKNGKTHTYWRLVRSVRRGRKVCQETVAQLGELDAEGRAKASALAKHFLGKRAEQPSEFEATERLEPAKVRLNDVRVERSRAFGDVWLSLLGWQALELDKFCETAMAVGKESIPWSTMAAILVTARLCEPSSELHIAEDWFRRTALEDLLGVEPASVTHTRLYETLDELLPHKRALEVHLKKRIGELFTLDFDLLLYDVTSTYFEGQAAGNPMAKRGYSRDHRPDCKQVCIGLVVTRDGFPLGYEVFDGNKVDTTTLEDVVKEMESRYGKAKRIWVMDRGFASRENLEWMQSEGRLYLIGTPKAELKKWEAELLEKRGWAHIRDGLEVKLVNGPGGVETFILCRSEDRRKKEEAMHERFTQRLAKDLERLARRLEHAKSPIDRPKTERQIGRMLGRNSRAAARFDVQVVEDKERASGLRLQWKENKDWVEWAKLTDGTYILRTNVTTWNPEALWAMYVQLTEAEAAFRVQKSDLQIRPIWHHKQDRVLAHILVCFLGYAVWKTLQGWMCKAKLGSSPRTLLEEMARITSTDVVLPLEGGREVRLRCVVRPDKSQQDLLDRMGLRLPSRLKMPEAPTAEPHRPNTKM
jgi:transposase